MGKKEKKDEVLEYRLANKKTIKQYKKELLEEYIKQYSCVLGIKEIKNIIESVVISYNPVEGISFELSCKFKVDYQIIKTLSYKYNQDYESEESLEILMFLIDMYLPKLKDKYVFLTENNIEKVIEKTLQEYTEENNLFKVAIEIKLKKMLKK